MVKKLFLFKFPDIWLPPKPATEDGVEIDPGAAPECEWDRAGNNTLRICQVGFRRTHEAMRWPLTVAEVDLPNWDHVPSVHITTARAA